MKNVEIVKNEIKGDIKKLDVMLNSFKLKSKKEEISSKIFMANHILYLIEKLEKMQMCLMNTEGDTQLFLGEFYAKELERIDDLTKHYGYSSLIEEKESENEMWAIVNDGH